MVALNYLVVGTFDVLHCKTFSISYGTQHYCSITSFIWHFRYAAL